MKKVGLLAALSTLLMAGSAMAADMPLKAPRLVVYNWTGFYIGANAGYAWGNSDWAPVPGTPQGSHTTRGGLIGGQIGYNWQAGPMVFGVEAEGDWANIKGSHLDPTATLLETKVNALGSLSARFGYAMNNVLLYGKAGGAVAAVKYNDSFGGALNGAASANRTGYLLGLGVEYGFSRHWTAKLEYNYVNLGTNSYTLSGGGAAPFVESIRDRMNVLKAGLNYRF